MKKELKYIITCIVIFLASFNLANISNNLAYVYYSMVNSIIFISAFLLLIFDKETKDLLLLTSYTPLVIYNFISKGIAIYFLGTILIFIGCIIHFKKFKITFKCRFLDLYLVAIISVSVIIGVACGYFGNYSDEFFDCGIVLLLINLLMILFTSINSTNFNIKDDKEYYVLLPLVFTVISLIYGVKNLSILYLIPVVIIFMTFNITYLKSNLLKERIIGYICLLFEINYVLNYAICLYDLVFLCIVNIVIFIILIKNNVKIWKLITLSSAIALSVILMFIFDNRNFEFKPIPSIFLLHKSIMPGGFIITDSKYNEFYDMLTYYFLHFGILLIIPVLILIVFKYIRKSYKFLNIFVFILIDLISLTYFNVYYFPLISTLSFVFLIDYYDIKTLEVASK